MTKTAVDSFIKSKQAKGLSPQTLRWYKGILARFANEYTRLPSLPEEIEEFLCDCTAGDERRHGYYRALRCFYRFLNHRLNIYNPVEMVEPPRKTQKRARYLSPENLNKLINYPLKPKIKAAILFLIDTGARLGELASLTIDDLEESPWGFMARITGKTGERIVPISYQTYHALMVHLPFNYSSHWLGEQISRAFKLADVIGSAHVLRHTFATLWQGDELVLQNILGHTHLETTRIYRHLRTQMLSQQHHQYSPLKMVLSSSKNML